MDKKYSYVIYFKSKHCSHLTICYAFLDCTTDEDCNNKGICETKTGLCNCNPGYRSTRDCSGDCFSCFIFSIVLQ